MPSLSNDVLLPLLLAQSSEVEDDDNDPGCGVVEGVMRCAPEKALGGIDMRLLILVSSWSVEVLAEVLITDDRLPFLSLPRKPQALETAPAPAETPDSIIEKALEMSTEARGVAGGEGSFLDAGSI